MANNRILMALVGGVAIFIILVFYFQSTPSVTPLNTDNNSQVNPEKTMTAPPSSPSTTKKTPSANSNTSIKEETILMTHQAFSPQTLTIPVGTRVRFINKDTADRWPASGAHPTHEICPGLDSLHSLKPGASYVFTFNQIKICPIHDHLDPTIHAVINITPK